MAVVGEVFDFRVNDSTLTGMINKINSFTDVGAGGVFGIWILVVIFGSLTLMLKDKGGMERALSVSTFISAIIGLFLRLLGLINDYVFYICIALFIVAGIFLIKEASQYE